MERNNTNWNDIPSSILIKVFEYLSIIDRRNAAFTCKSWCQILDSPLIWRDFYCTFTHPEYSQLSGRAWCSNGEAVQIASRYGAAFEILKVDLWAFFPNSYDETAEIASSHLTQFFKSLLKQRPVPQLTELHFGGGWNRDFHDTFYEEAILTIAQYLRTQRNLKTFSVRWRLNTLYGSLILDALRSTSTSIKKLNLVECFRTETKRSPNFLMKYMSPYTNLTTLQWNYLDLGSETFMMIATNCKKTLNCVSISCDFTYLSDFKPEQVHKISYIVWKRIRTLVPELKVEFRYASKNQDLEFVQQIIPKEIPLVSLLFNEGTNATQFVRYFRSFSSTLESAIFSFASAYDNHPLTLQKISDSDAQELSESLLQFVSSCPKLRVFDVWARLPLSIVDPLFNLVITHQCALQTLSIIFIVCSSEEEEQLEEIRRRYAYLHQEGILHWGLFSFRIDVPPN